MYEVRVAITPTNLSEPNNKYKRKILTGVYIPKDVKVKVEKIKEQVYDFIKTKVTPKDKNIVCNYTISVIRKIKTDFTVCEDKE